MSIFALLFLLAALILAIVSNARAWWVYVCILIGTILALVVTHGTMVTWH